MLPKYPRFPDGSTRVSRNVRVADFCTSRGKSGKLWRMDVIPDVPLLKRWDDYFSGNQSASDQFSTQGDQRKPGLPVVAPLIWRRTFRGINNFSNLKTAA